MFDVVYLPSLFPFLNNLTYRIFNLRLSLIYGDYINNACMKDIRTLPGSYLIKIKNLIRRYPPVLITLHIRFQSKFYHE